MIILHSNDHLINFSWSLRKTISAFERNGHESSKMLLQVNVFQMMRLIKRNVDDEQDIQSTLYLKT